jgi:hypothetical protein
MRWFPKRAGSELALDAAGLWVLVWLVGDEDLLCFVVVLCRGPRLRGREVALRLRVV